MRVQIREGEIIGYGVEINGDETFEGAPEDYDFEKYSYTPNANGSFNPEGFKLIENEN
jgi:hypothetical protein